MTQDGVVLRWQGGGDGTVVETDGVHAVVRSTRQAAPGTPLWAEASLSSGKKVRFKVKQCRRIEGDSFLLRGRWIDLPKKTREEILKRCESGESGDA